MCGKPATTKARIEGAIMSVCAGCASFGKELAPPKPVPKVSFGGAPGKKTYVAPGRAPLAPRSLHSYVHHASSNAPAASEEFVLLPDAGARLRNARRKMNLTEEEAANKMMIKKVDLLHFESGKLHPNESMTRKLEKFYGISLTTPS
jgi:ribosome-binding protein aMBF1 (putative translation factor)